VDVYGYRLPADRDAAPGHGTIEGTGVGAGVGLGVRVGLGVADGEALGDAEETSVGPGVGLGVWATANGDSLGTGGDPQAPDRRPTATTAASRADG
jgi:hypothetical protein